MFFNCHPAARRRWRWLCLIPLLTACSTTGRVTEATTGCAWTRPIRVSRQDQLTDLTARQILAHNEAGRRLCGWQPNQPANPPHP
ncbi:hypothetical protein ABU614_06715 [Lysobacter firmicutimachus]|uniref:Uncharacterized protein n=1 Tax=Lysobacter firmicutimachus TaxID=1792846 RepID=A0AAU8MW55_9GAMM